MTGKTRFIRPDYMNSPDCPGYAECDGRTNVCPIFGLVALCIWPAPIVCDSRVKYWFPAEETSLAESWLPR